jgi:hypothetical protein
MANCDDLCVHGTWLAHLGYINGSRSIDTTSCCYSIRYMNMEACYEYADCRYSSPTPDEIEREFV